LRMKQVWWLREVAWA